MQRIAVITLFLMVTFTWGTTWLAMRIAVETIPPLFATGMRFMLAAPFLIAIARITKTPLLFPAGQRLFQLAISIFYFSIPFSLMIYGEKYVSSGLASIIFSTMPVAVLLASILMLKERTSVMQLSGLAIATLALAGILLKESTSGISCQWQGILALVIAVVMHAILYAKCRERSCKVPVITFNALPCLLAGLMLLVTGWVLERPQTSDFSTYSIFSTFYLGAFAGVFGILAYFALQKTAGAFKASLVFLIFPMIAVSLENRVYGHAISAVSLFLLLPLALGILLALVPVKSAITNRDQSAPEDHQPIVADKLTSGSQ